ncbi:MAG: hypothetical protein Q9164_005862 [Protoblastenia rupestris]
MSSLDTATLERSESISDVPAAPSAAVIDGSPYEMITEYVAQAVDDLFLCPGNFLFKSYGLLELVEALDQQERAYRDWEGQQERYEQELNRPDRPKWLPLPSVPHRMYLSLRKEILRACAMIGRPDDEDIFWELRQCCKRPETWQIIRGGPRDLQSSGEYEVLLQMTLSDMHDIKYIVPNSQHGTLDTFRRSIERYLHRFSEYFQGWGPEGTWKLKANPEEWFYEHQYYDLKEYKETQKWRIAKIIEDEQWARSVDKFHQYYNQYHFY